MSFCKHCGTELLDAAKFCKKCGAPVTAQQPKQTTAPSSFVSSPAPTTDRVPVTKSMEMGNSMSKGGAPNFTPPIGEKMPSFSAPRGGGCDCCYCHTDEPAVTTCASCGKPICRDCADNYQISGNEFEGKPICYECCNAIFQEELNKLSSDKKKIYMQFVITFIGMIIGAIIGVEAGPMGILIGFLIGGCLLTFAWTFIIEFGKGFIALVGAVVSGGDGSFIGAIFSAVFNIVVAGIKAIWGTFSKLIRYTIHLLRTKNFEKEDMAIMQQIRDYYEYTMVRYSNKGVDLSVLASEGNVLANNSFAQAVMQNGEAKAEENLRQITMMINEHGEIVRQFAA